MLLAKVLYRPGFAYLTCTSKNQWLSTFLNFPGVEFLYDETIHDNLAFL